MFKPLKTVKDIVRKQFTTAIKDEELDEEVDYLKLTKRTSKNKKDHECIETLKLNKEDPIRGSKTAFTSRIKEDYREFIDDIKNEQ